MLSPGEGNGAPSRLLAKLVGCKIVGIDINPMQVKKAKECAKLHQVEDKVEYYIANVENFDLPNKNFTKCYVNETCGHWQYKEKAFRCIYKHLKDNALIGFNAWLKGDEGTLNDAYNVIEDFKKFYKKGIWFQENLETYKNLLEKCGFKVIDMFDCTDQLDIAMLARIKLKKQWESYGKILGKELQEKNFLYYLTMQKTHYRFLRYGVILAKK